MPVSLFEYLSIRRPPTGRSVFALYKMDAIAAPEREPGLHEHIEKAISHGHVTLGLERDWLHQRANQSTRRGDAMLVDNEFDRSWSSLHSYLRGQILGPPADPVRVAAETVLARALPLGVGAVTQLSFELQLGASDAVLELFSGELAPYVPTLRLERHIDSIKEVSGRFRKELEKETRPLTWDKVAAAQARMHELYAAVILNVLGRYVGEDHASRARREALLSEVNRQDALLGDLYRRRRPVVDVDPESGEEVAPPEPAPAIDAA